MKNRVFVLVTILLLPFVLAACATMSKEECVAADWRVVGETDGANGQDPQRRFADHTKSCQKAGIVPNQSLWYQGFQQGLTRYCTPLNGLNAGQSGKPYNNVCPVDLSTGFLQGYSIGKAEYNQRSKVQSVQNRIDAVEREIDEVRAKLAKGQIDEQVGKTLLRRSEREIDRLRFEKQREELELRTIERDGEIFASNPNMVIPPRY